MKKVFKFYLMLFLSITGTVFTTNAETKKILVVGNSFSFDAALQELLPIVQAAGDDIVLGFPYKGGTTLELHTNYITGNQQIYNYYQNQRWENDIDRRKQPKIRCKYHYG